MKNDDAGMLFGAIMTGATIAMFGCLFLSLVGVDNHWIKQRYWRFASAIIACGLTAFLWVPWVVYGVSQLYAWNSGKINDLNAPIHVLPPSPIIRPSAADAVEK